MGYIPYTIILTLALTLALFILKACHYIGYTGRGNFEEESYAFLTARGAAGPTDEYGNYLPQEDDEPVRLNRAVILWKNGDNVKKSEAGNQKKTLVLTLTLTLTLTLSRCKGSGLKNKVVDPKDRKTFKRLYHILNIS